jgi:uncharacterized membrane protein
MNEDNFGAHLHLLVNDVPILGFFFVAVFLATALITNNRETWTRAALLTLVISFVGMIVAFFSGDPALKVIDGQPRTSGRALTQHHIRGLVASGLALVTIAIAIVTQMKSMKTGGSYSKKLITLLLVATFLSAAALAWTGEAGGRINHYELQQPADREGEPAHPH